MLDGSQSDKASATTTIHGCPIPTAVLLDEDATVIDFAGPWEVLQDASLCEVAGFALYTVAPTRAPIVASAGMEIVPSHVLEDAPQPKVVVIPAQSGARKVASATDAKVEWLRYAAADADIVMSVCTGAFLLARTGLLDGLTATTHHRFCDEFAATFPAVRLHRGRRFVDNGRFVCAGGLTSGIDASLHIAARYYGVETARMIAAYMEHDSVGWRSGTRDASPTGHAERFAAPR